jgi:hypothetical protein
VRALASAGLAAVLARGALHALARRPPGPVGTWDRVNHAGTGVSLLEGPAYAAGAALAAGMAGAGAGPVLAATASAGLGALDDLRGDSGSKGLKGHLTALARGEVTTGAVKVVGLAVTGLATTVLVDRSADRSAHRAAGRAASRAGDRRASRSAVDTLVGGAVVAGCANLLNLLDLRPGRALKAALVLGLLTGTSPSSSVAAAGAAGAAAGLIGPDLRGETMLGDTGANSAGALLGAALVQRCGRRGRWWALAALAALTLASEKVSFTVVIESTPVLRELDALGRP